MNEYQKTRWTYIYGRVDRLKVVSETEKFITVEHSSWNKKPYTRRQSKAGTYETFAEMKAAVIEEQRNKIADYEAKLARSQAGLDHLLKLQEPE